MHQLLAVVHLYWASVLISADHRTLVTLTVTGILNAGARSMLKYTPEHAHCLANVYGALAPPGTGVLAIQSLAADQQARTRLVYPESMSCLLLLPLATPS